MKRHLVNVISTMFHQVLFKSSGSFIKFPLIKLVLSSMSFFIITCRGKWRTYLLSSYIFVFINRNKDLIKLNRLAFLSYTFSSLFLLPHYLIMIVFKFFPPYCNICFSELNLIDLLYNIFLKYWRSLNVVLLG